MRAYLNRLPVGALNEGLAGGALGADRPQSIAEVAHNCHQELRFILDANEVRLAHLEKSGTTAILI